MSGAALSPLRTRLGPRSGAADRMLGWTGQARVYSGELVHPIVQALRDAALRVWLWIRSRPPKEQLEEGWIQAGYQKIAAALRLDKSTVFRAVRDLVQVGLLEKDPQYGIADGAKVPSHLPNCYRACVHIEVEVEQDLERKRRAHARAIQGWRKDCRAVQRDNHRLAKAGQPESPLPPRPEPPPELAPRPLIQTAEPDPALHERAEDLAEQLERANVRQMAELVAPQRTSLDQLADQLGALPTFAPPAGVERLRFIDAAQDCLRAIDRRKQAGAAIELAVLRLAELEADIADETPPGPPDPRRWRKLSVRLRMALTMASGCGELVADAVRTADQARQTWGRIITPTRASPQVSLPIVERPPQPGERWYPPQRWAPITGAPQRRVWWAHRALARLVQEGSEAWRRLMAQGFDPDWPDPWKDP